VMEQDTIAPPAHTTQLADELATHHGDPSLAKARSMGELLGLHLALQLG